MFEAELLEKLKKTNFKQLHSEGRVIYGHNCQANLQQISYLFGDTARGLVFQFEVLVPYGVNPDKKIIEVLICNLYFNYKPKDNDDFYTTELPEIGIVDVQKTAKDEKDKTVLIGVINGFEGDVDNAFHILTKMEEHGKFLTKWVRSPIMFLGCSASLDEILKTKDKTEKLRSMESQNYRILQQMNKKDKKFLPLVYEIHPGIGTHEAF